MRGRYKGWTPLYIDAHPSCSPRSIDPSDPFYRGRLVLEIGSGKGGYLVKKASLHPDVRFLGLERDVSSCGSGVKKAVEAELNNVRICNLDFDEAYEDLKGLSFEEIHVHFPDPWPKRRHEKRRLLYPERLRKILSLLAPGGRLEFRTDNDALYAYFLESYPLAGGRLLEGPYPPEEAMSEYEERFRAEGMPIHRAYLERI